MIQQIFYVVLALSFVLVSCASGASERSVHAPFNVEEIRAHKGRETLGAIICPESLEPIQNLQFQRFYDNKNGSHINPVAYEAYKKQYRPLSKYETNIIGQANHYVESKPARSGYARCVLSWLDDWAEGRALLGKMSPNGEFVRKWMLASLSLAYVQVKGDKALDQNKKDNVEKWLHEIGSHVIEDYSTRTYRRSRQNNHLYWAAWSLAITSVAVQDTVFFDWAMNKAEFGLQQIEEDGTLPHEVYRKSMALHYHLFATVPLVLLAEIGAANNRDLYGINNGALHRLIKRELDGIEDPSYFAEIAKAKQNMGKVTGTTLLSWTEAYHTRFPKRQSTHITKWQNKLRPIYYSRIGGNTALLYGAHKKSEKGESDD